jgi:NAD(P)-dependent dehydrogenase (short-subunit alcohol dehydrogenase family)
MLEKFFNFKNKIILITGCSGQIGQSIVSLFLGLGSKVYGLDIKSSKPKNNFSFIKCDITNQKSLKKTIDRIITKEKTIDIIINNAGISTFGDFKKRNDDELNKIFKTNVTSMINLIKHYLIAFDKKKLKSAKIINIGSIYGFLSPDFKIYEKGDRFSPEIYGATKSAIIQLTKYYAVLLANRNINVNCISPGGIINKDLQSKSFIKKYVKRVPKKRMGHPSDLLTSIIFLASESSEYITGQNIIIDGGLSLK